MGLMWQYALRNTGVSLTPDGEFSSAADADAFENQLQAQQLSATALVLGLGFLALAVFAPETIPVIAGAVADAAFGEVAAGATTDVAAGAASDVAAGAASDEPYYITWAKNVVDNPNGYNYSEDSLEKAERILIRNKML
jgi:hypothetical protein